MTVFTENMCRIIFQAGLNWHVFDNKWSTIKKAFTDFNIHDIANFTNTAVEKLMRNPGIIRNKARSKQSYKTHRTSDIEKQYGSFQKYLDALEKSENYTKVVKDLVNKFKWLGSPSASLFLYTVGEKIEPW
jgi:DNA-3-methyladenine glycosylase I